MRYYSTLDVVLLVREHVDTRVRLLPIEPAIAIDSVRLPGSFHADPADRLILATARYSRAPLITADSAMIEYAGGGHLRVVDASL
ncbi:MAG: type II toxin-antitoxin system VapC family toxin [Acidobacteria bacterium]|nr:type II toxin-antitoxin system VapC family toxin [Acidobacteriota bacterium]